MQCNFAQTGTSKVELLGTGDVALHGIQYPSMRRYLQLFTFQRNQAKANNTCTAERGRATRGCQEIPAVTSLKQSHESLSGVISPD